MGAVTLEKNGKNDAFFVDIKIRGKTEATFKALIDTGASVSYVVNDGCLDNGLVFRGTNKDVVCIHGKKHSGFSVPVYRGDILIGDILTPNVIIIGLGDDVTMGSEKIEAVLGRNILKRFEVNLDWKNCRGEMN